MKKHLTGLWPLPSLFIIALPLHSQQAGPPAPPVIRSALAASSEPEISVDELVRRALENNPQLSVARHTQEAAKQRLAARRGLRNPTLELVPGLGSREARDEEVILAQPLDIFGKRRAQADVSAAELRRAEADTSLAERSLVVQVKNTAADLFAAQEAESLGEVQVEVAQLFRDAAARRAQLGDVPPVQVQRADLELLRVQNELTNAQAERLARRAALNQLIQQAPETPLRVALPFATGLTDLLRARPGALPAGVDSAPAVNTPLSPNSAPVIADAPLGSTAQVDNNLIGLRGKILPDALANRPDVLGAQATLEARRAEVGALRRERLPDVEVQARRSSFFGRAGSYALRAVVTLPLFDFGSLKSERRAAEAQVRAQEATVNLLRSQVAMQIEQALLRLQQRRATVERYRSGIVPISIDLLRKTEIGYRAGASTYLEVLEAQRTLRQVQTEYLQALVGTRVGEAQLESALGATPSAAMIGPLTNPVGPALPPGIAAPGTVPEGTIPPTIIVPLNPPGALGTPPAPANATGVRQP